MHPPSAPGGASDIWLPWLGSGEKQENFSHGQEFSGVTNLLMEMQVSSDQSLSAG
jgi:hypothetical protein